MGVFLAVILVTYALTKLVQEGRTDREYARKGMVSPRHQVRLARLEAAGRPPSPTERGPLRNYLSELYADAMLDLAEKHRAKRATRAPFDPDRPSLAQRFDRAVLDGLDRAKRSRGWDMAKGAASALIEPVGERARKRAAAGGPPTPTEPEPAGTAAPSPDGDESPPEDARRSPPSPTGAVDPDNTQPPPPTGGPAATGGTDMTSPVNTEATTFETAQVALGDLATATQNLSDHVAGAVGAAATFQAHVEEIDQAKRDVADAVAAVGEQLGARGVDAATVGQVSAAMELINAGDLTGALDHIEGAKALLAGSQAAAQEASGAVGGAQQTLTATYGDAYATMAAHGTDGAFIDGGGGPALGAAGRYEARMVTTGQGAPPHLEVRSRAQVEHDRRAGEEWHRQESERVADAQREQTLGRMRQLEGDGRAGTGEHRDLTEGLLHTELDRLAGH